MGEVKRAYATKTKRIPAIRFPEFGVDWTESKLGEFYKKLRTGMTPSRANPEYFKGDNLWISSGELGYNIIDDTREKITNQAIVDTGLRLYPKGTFFIAITGLEAPGTRGKCAINGVVATTNQSCMAFEEVPEILNKFLFYWYSSFGVQLYFRFAQGSKQQSFNNRIVENFKVILPTLPEQTKIANFLTAVDAKIANLTEEKSLLENYKKGVMQKIFSQELRFKQDDGSDFPEWETKRLGEVFSIGSGKDYKHLSEGDIPVYGTGGLMKNVNEFLFDGKSVCIGRKGTIDKPMLLNGKFWTVDTLFYTHSFKNVTPEFVYYVFLGINWQKFNEASGVPSLSKRTIEQIPIEHPIIEEQTKIANFLTSIDEKINTATEAIENAQAFKKGLLQQLFV